jgi:hypothetical protein
MSAASFTYLASGLVNSYAIPAGTYSSLTYDLEGDLLSYVASGSGVPSPVTVHYSYSDRGTLGAMGAGGNAVFPALFDAGGALLPPPAPFCYLSIHNQQYCGNFYPYFDGRSSAPLGVQWVANGDPGPSPPTPNPVNYDAAGRQTRKTFDVLNHVIVSGAQAYAWGPNNHAIFTAHAADGHVPRTIHWLGDRILFSTVTNSTYEDLKLTSFANWTPGGVLQNPVVSDRDLSGLTVSSRTLNNGQDAWIVPNPYSACNDATKNGMILATPAPNTNVSPFNCNPSASTPPPQYGGLFYEARSDGYWDGVSELNGVRAYDSDILAWSSADAAAGSSGDPIGQLPYAYSRNNPVTLGDATGLCPTWETSRPQANDPSLPIDTGYSSWIVDDGSPCPNPMGWDNFPYIPYFDGFGGIGGSAGAGGLGSGWIGFRKYTANFESLTLAYAATACGERYLILGPSAGVPPVSFSATAGQVSTWDGSPATSETYNGVMSGASGGYAIGAGLGFEAFGNSSGYANAVGGFWPPQASVSYTYGIPLNAVLNPVLGQLPNRCL